MRPRIGITGPDRGGGMAWFFTAMNILIAGGRPVRVTPSRPAPPVRLDGLILGGGADVDPESYQHEGLVAGYIGQTLKAPRISIFRRAVRFITWFYYPLIFLLRILFSRKSTRISRERDRVEFNMMDTFRKQGKPILGICRGSQLINVYFGGTLYENIDSFYYEKPNPYSIFPVKTICMEPGSRLARIIGRENLEVNALHHQAVRETGKDIRVSAREKNEVVQGIEYTGNGFVVGVQWHPEYLIFHRHQRRLFRALVDEACSLKNLKCEQP